MRPAVSDVFTKTTVHRIVRLCFFFGVTAVLWPVGVAASDGDLSGKQIYQKQCGECHGPNGERVPDATEEPLHGDLSLPELITVINDTMPEEKPETCTGKDAEKVARYIFKTFYTREAREENKAARIELTRLTVRQHLNVSADLLASVDGMRSVDERRGLKAEYFKTRSFRGNERVVDRIDPRVDFDFGEKTPAEGIPKPEEFSIRWQGSITAEETGEYEFFVKTENGTKLWVNGRETPLIDAWVSSQGRAREHVGTIRLLGGRAYPIRLDVFKFKEKSASIVLEWKPPRKAREVIPQRSLVPVAVPETFVASTVFPPDDAISGYERGTSVSREWDHATTRAALEMATRIADRLDRLTGTRPDAADRKKKAQEFCRRFAERAFRRPLSEEQRQFFVDAHFESAGELESAVKRSVLLVLKSPRFLYPSISPTPDDYGAATRLSLGLWDSLPDRVLLQAAAQGKLRTPEQIAAQAKRMLADPRAKSKLRHFFHHWLQLDEKEELTKDKELFPGFDDLLVGLPDLGDGEVRTSLDLFLDDVVWNGTADFRELLLANHVFMNARLAAFYGADAPADTGFAKVEFDPQQRSGVVTHPYMMASFAYPRLSSPIHRGVFVTRRLVGRALKPPPQAIEFKEGDFKPGMTTREKVALLTKPTACQSCHGVINPLGFTMEHYDAVGRYRESEEKKPVDATTLYSTADGNSVELNGARGLAEFIADSPRAHGIFVDQVFHQAVKQPINAFGPTTRDDLIAKFAASEFNIKQLLVGVMTASVLYEPAP